MYGASLNEFEPIVDAFRQRFPGIEVETQIFRAPESMQRLAAEATSGKQIGNVVSHGETSMSTMDADGVFADWEGPPNAALLPGISISAGRTRWPLNEAVHGMMINTSLVPPDKYPTSPQSFLDPFYRGKGKLLLEDPRSTGASLDFFTQASDKYGQEFLDKVKAQEPTFTRDRILAPIQVARGEFAVFFPMSIAAEHFRAAGGRRREGGHPQGASDDYNHLDRRRQRRSRPGCGQTVGVLAALGRGTEDADREESSVRSIAGHSATRRLAGV